jgi:hypothetical protein
MVIAPFTRHGVFMGLSETILAAMIGAIATVTTALFQIFTAFKARGKVDLKPKRGSTMRSVLAVMALMIASAAGGFLYSELLRQRGGEDIRAMRQELRELRDLTAANVRERGNQEIPVNAPAEQPLLENAQATSISQEPVAGSAESVAYVPACRRSPAALNATPILNASGETTTDCVETEAQRIALCGSIPAAARVEQIQLFAQPDAVQQPWTQHVAAVEQDIGGARFTGKTFEYAQGGDVKSVCVNFMHWSGQHPHIARILVQYRLGQEPEIPSAPAAAAAEAAPVMTQTLINSESTQAVLPQTAAFAAPGSVE